MPDSCARKTTVARDRETEDSRLVIVGMSLLDLHPIRFSLLFFSFCCFAMVANAVSMC